MSFWSRPRNLVILGGVIVGSFFVTTFGAKTTYAIFPSSPSELPRIFSCNSFESYKMHSSAIGCFRPLNHTISKLSQPLTDSFSTHSNPFETQGSKNIGARWSAGGGSDVHTPGAATPRGNSENTQENQVEPKGCFPPQAFP